MIKRQEVHKRLMNLDSRSEKKQKRAKFIQW